MKQFATFFDACFEKLAAKSKLFVFFLTFWICWKIDYDQTRIKTDMDIS